MLEYFVASDHSGVSTYDTYRDTWCSDISMTVLFVRSRLIEGGLQGIVDLPGYQGDWF